MIGLAGRFTDADGVTRDKKGCWVFRNTTGITIADMQISTDLHTGNVPDIRRLVVQQLNPQGQPTTRVADASFSDQTTVHFDFNPPLAKGAPFTVAIEFDEDFAANQKIEFRPTMAGGGAINGGATDPKAASGLAVAESGEGGGALDESGIDAAGLDREKVLRILYIIARILTLILRPRPPAPTPAPVPVPSPKPTSTGSTELDELLRELRELVPAQMQPKTDSLLDALGGLLFHPR
ncbi:hypothetical protein [Chitinolyticbacter albus]|uniref:hypothetical protein n=1 Tax=Chitinolyticbacter albus TaxID=2961951 RepID=UPI00210A46C3|nr:hypothetical protein [Chitinolyticbacter albus]